MRLSSRYDGAKSSQLRIPAAASLPKRRLKLSPASGRDLNRANSLPAKVEGPKGKDGKLCLIGGIMRDHYIVRWQSRSQRRGPTGNGDGTLPFRAPAGARGCGQSTARDTTAKNTPPVKWKVKRQERGVLQDFEEAK